MHVISAADTFREGNFRFRGSFADNECLFVVGPVVLFGSWWVQLLREVSSMYNFDVLLFSCRCESNNPESKRELEATKSPFL